MPVDARRKYHEYLAEKSKNYKTEHDVDRAQALAHTLTLLKDYPTVSALAAAFGRELAAMNQKQVEIDAKEKEADEKAWAEATQNVELPEPAENPPSRSARR